MEYKESKINNKKIPLFLRVYKLLLNYKLYAEKIKLKNP